MIKLNLNLDFQIKPENGIHNNEQTILFITDVTKNELSMIVNCIAENHIDNYLEIGVYYGATLYNIVNLFKMNGHILDAYGYDCFNQGVRGDNSHTSGWPDFDTVKRKLKNLPEIKLIVGEACEVDKVITHRKFDFVFHDANHTENAIVEDLIVLKNILNPNAFVAVHNSTYDEPHRNFYGRSAVEKLIAQGHYKLVNYADTAVLLQMI